MRIALGESGSSISSNLGLTVIQKEELSPDFAGNIQLYLDKVHNEFCQGILENYDQEMYDDIERGIPMWRNASEDGIISHKERNQEELA